MKDIRSIFSFHYFKKMKACCLLVSLGLVFGGSAGICIEHLTSGTHIAEQLRFLKYRTPKDSQSLYSEYLAADVQESSSCVFKLVSDLMNIKVPSQDELPRVMTEGEVSLEELQTVTNKLWGFAVPRFVNIYDHDENRILLFRDLDFYEKFNRSIYDSIAHEFVHFIQVKIRKTPFASLSEVEEMEAVHIQNQFREKYASLVKDHKFHCPY